MTRFLVQIATGPENPTRAALGLLFARTAADEGHDVRVFLAGDAVHLARAETAPAVQGIGTGPAADHLTALRDAGVPVALSGRSSAARGVDGDGAELAPPERLVEFAAWAEAVLTY
jgi:uncharacterized protein